MTPQKLQRIPIKEIRVVNPRSRNRQTFLGIVNSIELVGLKKPITVARRPPAEDGTQYDLVCGQGRLEAVAALGGRVIPAIVTEAPRNERYLMSLIENVARYQPPHTALLKEVKNLRNRGYSIRQIAAKLGLGRSYIDGILQLLRSGEEHLVARVEAGSLPLTIAIQIATGDKELEMALSQAYERGELRGGKLRTVQRLVTNRHAKGQENRQDPSSLSKDDLARQYEEYTAKQRTLAKQALVVHERLALLGAAFKHLLADADFTKLLRVERLDSIPEQLAIRMQ
jgi:ParB family chromosome partitioning protein